MPPAFGAARRGYRRGTERRVKPWEPQLLVVPISEKSCPEPETQLSHRMPRDDSRALCAPRCCDRVSDVTLVELVKADLRLPRLFLSGKDAELAVDQVAESDFEQVEATPEDRGDLDVPFVEAQGLVFVAVAGSKVAGEPATFEQACQLSVQYLLS